MGIVYLILAIIFEVCGTTMLKLTNGFTNLIPSVIFVICYAISFFLLSQTLKTIDIAIAYAIWSAVGMTLIALIGIFCFQEHMNTIKLISLLLIIIGVVGLRIGSIA